MLCQGLHILGVDVGVANKLWLDRMAIDALLAFVTAADLERA